MLNRLKQRGFTLIEVVVVMAITTMGFVALLNLQIGTLHGAASARDMQGAIALAEHLSQTMRMEALQWTPNNGNPSPATLTSLKYLSTAPAQVTPGTTSDWIIGYKPVDSTGSTDLRVGPVGNDVAYDSGVLNEIGTTFNSHYCVHYRLTWLTQSEQDSNGLLLRADIRVMWARNRGDFTPYSQCPLTMVDELTNIHTITIPVTILRNVFVRQV